MSETKRMAQEFRRAVEGGAWHGPALLETLEGVESAQAGQIVLLRKLV